MIITNPTYLVFFGNGKILGAPVTTLLLEYRFNGKTMAVVGYEVDQVIIIVSYHIITIVSSFVIKIEDAD